MKAPKSRDEWGGSKEAIGHHCLRSCSLLASDTWQAPPGSGRSLLRPVLSLLTVPFNDRAPLSVVPEPRASLRSQPGSRAGPLPTGCFREPFPRTPTVLPLTQPSRPCLTSRLALTHRW